MALQIAGAVASAGISAIGGLFARKDQKKQAALTRSHEHDINRENYEQTRLVNDRIERHNADVLANHSTEVTKVTDNSGFTTLASGAIDFKKLVADAEGAGFNPLTVLRSGGLAGYFTTNTAHQNFGTITTERKAARDVMSFISPNATPGVNAAPQMVNPFEGAANILANAAASYDPYAAQRREMERGLALAQIRNLDSDTAANSRRFTIPSWTGSGVTTSSGGFTGAARAVQGGTLGGQPIREEGEVKVTNPFPWGSVQGWLSDAAATEERYGELLSNAAGVINLGFDGLGLVHQAGKAAQAVAPAPAKATDVAKGYFQRAYNAMVEAWNSPAWNAKLQ